MANKKWFTVMSESGLNLRAEPNLRAEVLKILDFGEKIEADWTVEAPDVWLPVKGGGFVMREFVK